MGEPLLLRDYQESIVEKGLSILMAKSLLYLAMETRTGKTITSLEIARRYGAKNVLFVTKKGVIQGALKDATLFGDALNVVCINHESIEKAFECGTMNLIMQYEEFVDNVLKKKSFKITQEVPAKYDLVIIDEAHQYKAYPKPSARTKVAKKLLKNLPIIFLSATPTPEGYADIFHQMWLSSYSPWKHNTFYAWVKDGYVKPTPHPYMKIRTNGREVCPMLYNDANEPKIKADLNPLMLTLTQKDAGFESILVEDVIHVVMKDKTSQIYKKFMRNGIYSDEEMTISTDSAVAKMQKAHQICSGTCIGADNIYIFDDSKCKVIRDHALKHGFNKIAVYYKFAAEKELLTHVFKNNVHFTPFEFQAANKGVFIKQIISGREGIKLSTADALYFLNIDFSSLSYIQTINRLQDYTRKEASRIYWVFSTLGLEDKILEAVKDKEDFTLSHFRRLR